MKKSGKVVRIWAIEGDISVSTIKSNTFEMEWPPKSGQMQEFPEIDQAAWFELPQAMSKIVRSRSVFLERLAEKLVQSASDREITPPKPPQQSLF